MDNIYAILDENGVITENILASEEFVSSRYTNYVLASNLTFSIGDSYLNGEIVRKVKPPTAVVINKSNYKKFYDLLLISTVYQKIRSEAVNNLSLTVACVEIVSALTDAKYGDANQPAIQATISNLLQSATTLIQDDLDELNSILESTKLNTLYTLS